MDLRQLAKAAAGKLHLLTEEEKRLLLKEIEELEAEDAKAMGEVPKIEWQPREEARDEVQKRLKDDEGGG